MTTYGPGRNPITRRWVTAGRDHRCKGCGAPIFKGARYWRSLTAGFCAPACDR